MDPSSTNPSQSPSTHSDHHPLITTTTLLAAGMGISSLAAIVMFFLLVYQRISHRRSNKGRDFATSNDFLAQQSDKSTTECMLVNHHRQHSSNSYSSPSPATDDPCGVEAPLPPAVPSLAIQISPSPHSRSSDGTGARDEDEAGPQAFTFQQLQIATNNFSAANVVGEGGFGCVYRGVLADGRLAAIKKLDLEGKQGEEEFRVEIEMLSRVRSPKLLKLLGYCTEDENKLLVYEYMSRGNLQQHLYPQENGGTFVPLDWTTRLRIALDAAKGLEFLHEFMAPPIIHRDFKCSNILLDERFHAKLSDFGLAKVGSNKVNGDVSTRVLGTHGYVAPEYVLTGHLTTKSDVYSFGVVLLEILTGRVPVDMKRPPGEGVLVSWALPRLTDRDKLVGLVDPVLAGQYTMKELIQVAAIAAMCIQPEADYRPLMIDVVQSLAPLVKQRLNVS